MHIEPKILNLLSEIFANKGREATEQRLEQGALILVKYIGLCVSLPAVILHLYLGWHEGSTTEARWLSGLWLAVLFLHLMCCAFVMLIPSGHLRLKRRLIYVSAVFELMGVGFFIHVTGGLMSPTVVFIPVMIAAYRVFLDFAMGLFITVVGLGIYLLVISLEIFAGASTQAYFPDLVVPFYAYPWASMIAAGSIAATCLICFAGINYGVNQTAVLHRYITESVLRRYLPPALVERAALGELRLEAAPERRVVTVMFVDLVGFTSIAERMTPEAVALMLNGYLSRAMELAHRQQATVDKFVGDAVMFFFGAPDPLSPEQQVERAIRLAQEIHADLRTQTGTLLRARIGINTGEVVVGNFGSQIRSEYTVLGHTVNLAARLEAACNPERILIGPETARYAAEIFALEQTENMRLKGISELVVGYYVLSPKSEADSAVTKLPQTSNGC